MLKVKNQTNSLQNAIPLGEQSTQRAVLVPGHSCTGSLFCGTEWCPFALSQVLTLTLWMCSAHIEKSLPGRSLQALKASTVTLEQFPGTCCAHALPGLTVQLTDTFIPHWNGCFERTALVQFSPYLSVISSMLVPNAQQCKSQTPTCSKVKTASPSWGLATVQEPLHCCFYRNFELVIQWSMFAFLLQKNIPNISLWYQSKCTQN